MEWHQIPWSAIVAVLIAIIGFIAWLIRLEGKHNQVEKDLTRETETTNKRFDAVNGVFTLIQGDIRELQIRTVNKDDLKEVKNELTESIEKVGDRTVAEVERLVMVMTKKTSSPRAPAKPRT